MFEVEIITRVGFAYCRARLGPSTGYPLMEIVECHEVAPVSDH
jgi:hypothetical protein